MLEWGESGLAVADGLSNLLKVLIALQYVSCSQIDDVTLANPSKFDKKRKEKNELVDC